MEAVINRSSLDAGLVMPYDFADRLHRRSPVDVQIVLNAVNANTAAIGLGYAQGILQTYNLSLAGRGVRLQTSSTSSAPLSIVHRTAFLYNPGLVYAWFMVTGTFGVLLILNGSLVSSTAMIKEREAGTVEQLLMTPAGTSEIIIAKIAPLFLLLMCMVVLAMVLMRVAFNVPFHGNFLLVFGERDSAFCAESVSAPL